MLDQLLRNFRLSATIFNRSLVCDRWKTDTSGSGLLNFHFVFQGTCYLHLLDGSVSTLHPGDFVLFPTDSGHCLSMMADGEELRRASTQFVTFPVQEALENSTGLVCGSFSFNDDSHHYLLHSLPDCILCRRDEMDKVLAWAVDMLLFESAAGREVSVLERCIELFFTLLLRHLFNSNPSHLRLFRAMHHPRLSVVLTAMHKKPEVSWTIEKMAELACLSKSAFYEAFQQILCDTPMSYLTRVRLNNAKIKLQQGVSVSAATTLAGYTSDEAFARAFKRLYGYGPGRARREYIALS